MNPTAKIEWVDPASLAQHPEQAGTYGAVGGDHDPTFAEFSASVAKYGVQEPLRASRGTPGLADNTLISGHRRLAAALARRLTYVPVIFERHESEAHAEAAHLLANAQRPKNEWILTQEAVAWRRVEGALAKQRQRASGGDRKSETAQIGSATGGGTDRGETREKVAARLGESKGTTDLRFKLAEKAREQNPENPSASPVAKALSENKPVKTVAREHGVIKPYSKQDRREKLLSLCGTMLHAESRQTLEAARAAASRLSPPLTDAEAAEVDAAYADSDRRLAAKPAAPPPDPRQQPLLAAPDALAPMAAMLWTRKATRLIDAFARDWAELLASRPTSYAADALARAAFESEAARLLNLVLDQLPDDSRPEVRRQFGVIHGGKS